MRDFFGIDVGDGAACVAWLRADSATEPQVVELLGGRSIITAVGETEDGRTLIGAAACASPEVKKLALRFKSRFLTSRAAASRLVERFAGELLRLLSSDGRVSDPAEARCFVGCPSGWDDEAREAYRQCFLRAGFACVTVVSESRAAYLYARESGELPGDPRLPCPPTLIVDAGSSTTDFTFVSERAETPVAVRDFGEVSLGGGLIDRLLLDMCLKRAPDAEEVTAALQIFPALRARLEGEARALKEETFARLSLGGDGLRERTARLPSGEALPLRADADTLRLLVKRPLKALGGLCIEDAYARALSDARERVPAAPERVLLTGGASRMPFLRALTSEAFPEAHIALALEPEYAIARGLCYAVRLDERTARFFGELRALEDSGALCELIRARLPELYEAVAPALADLLISDIAPPAFDLWREGGLDSINDLSAEITARLSAALSGGTIDARVSAAAASWLEQIRPDAEALTGPIAAKYGLPGAVLPLPELRAGAALSLSSGQLVGSDALKALLDVVIASLVAALLGGGGLALAAQGVPGLVAGFAIGLVTAIAGVETAQRLASAARLPVPARRLLISKRRFEKGLASRRDRLIEALREQLAGCEGDIAEDIASSVSEQLETSARRAALYLK